jgi:CRP-like cAMP-binding protein
MLTQGSRETDRSALAQFFLKSHRKSQHKKFSIGEVLFEENTAARGCHVIQSGNVELSVVCFDGSRVRVELVGTGSLIGVSAAFMERRYVLTATALSDTETIYVPRGQVARLFQRDPDLRLLILRSLSRSVQQAIRCFVATAC